VISATRALLLGKLPSIDLFLPNDWLDCYISADARV
jgi:hypothetical protein